MQSEGEGKGAGWDRSYTLTFSSAPFAGINTEMMAVLLLSPSSSTVILWKHTTLLQAIL